MKKTLISLMVAGALGLSMTACNTIQGAGKDVARGGEKIQDASIKVRSEWRDWWNRHDTDYERARTTCMGGSEATREACREASRADYRAKMAEARAKYKRAEMRSESEQERMEDAYENARDACYTLKGSDEDRCIADVRAKYPRR